MAETLVFTRGAAREKVYAEVVPQIRELVRGEPDVTANLANIAAVLKEAFGFLWVGFYMKKDGQLVLGPFQGPLACTRIDFGKGVCGTAFTTGETLLVPNVDEFPGHIVCSSDSKSEIVVPLFDGNGEPAGVLDVDSDRIDDFSDADMKGLKEIAGIVTEVLSGKNL
ncbi:MAG: GAF domain-containing protein [Acidobacteriota bacterium]|nr:MAG: GAF domain-containing protein [Acidobacteriota bacterium]